MVTERYVTQCNDFYTKPRRVISVPISGVQKDGKKKNDSKVQQNIFENEKMPNEEPKF